jgi:hypothetical protein
MALLTKWLTSDLWSAIKTKNDNLVDAVNEFAGGTIGQRLVKSSSTDFDVEYANPENIAKYTGASFSLSTMLIGEDYNFTTIHSSYVGNANQTVKFFSLANPSKFFIVNIESGTTSTNLVGRVTFNNNIADTTLISDWVIVPYTYQLRNDYVYGSLIFDDTQTDIFTNINAGGLSGVSGIEFQMQGSKIGKKVSINGGVSVFNSSQNLTDKKIDLYVDLDPNYESANQVGELSNINAIFPITGVVYNSSSTTVDQILTGFAYFNTTTQLVLQLNGNNTIALNKDVYFYFNINYIAKNYSA